jgi:hypothetical protein
MVAYNAPPISSHSVGTAWDLASPRVDSERGRVRGNYLVLYAHNPGALQSVTISRGIK